MTEKTATYRLVDGSDIHVTYDPEAPCIACGLPVFEASVGGTMLCPWCDMGVTRDGRRQDLYPRAATVEETRAGKQTTVFAPIRASKQEYEIALTMMRNIAAES